MDTDNCTSTHEALHLKIVAIASILIACALGVCMPLLGRTCNAFKAESNLFFVVKCFAAGVILATGFVHMLPHAFGALTSDHLQEAPWGRFPFAGFLAMMAALLTLMIDFWATAYYKRRDAQEQSPAAERDQSNADRDMASHGVDDDDYVSDLHEQNGKGLCMVTVHPQSKSIHQDERIHESSQCTSENHSKTGSHPDSGGTEEASQLRHRVISQVLELGILAHSVIIGVSLGTSRSPCTIRPLIAALSFHQFFEGIALGGCISQAGFESLSATIMGFFFSVTTPAGIAIGIGISSSYNEDSPTALIVEGIFDSISAGILVYMSLVDLIATDFLSKKMQSDSKLQVFSYVALSVGAGTMSMIAMWV